MEMFSNQESGQNEQGAASWIEKLKSKMPWVKSSERSENEPKKEERPASKDVELAIEPKLGEGLKEYAQRRSEKELVEKIARAKADLAEKIALYEKHKASMNKWELDFHKSMVRDEEARIRLMEKRNSIR